MIEQLKHDRENSITISESLSQNENIIFNVKKMEIGSRLSFHKEGKVSDIESIICGQYEFRTSL